MVREWLLFHKKLISDVLWRFVIRRRGLRFLTAANAVARLTRKSVRFNQVQKHLFTAVDKSTQLTVFFSNESQGYRCYRDGLKERAARIGQIYFLDKIPLRDNDRVIDCGANNGDIKLWFEFNSIAVKYNGIEPSPHEFLALQKNVGDGNAKNFGLWNADGEMKFYLSSDNGDSSLIEPERYDDVITVKTKRLEDVIDQPIRWLKLEAEGAEPEILQGAGSGLQLIDYISVDMGYERGKACESTAVDCINLLLTNGFELIEMSHDRIVGLFRRKHCD